MNKIIHARCTYCHSWHDDKCKGREDGNTCKQFCPRREVDPVRPVDTVTILPDEPKVDRKNADFHRLAVKRQKKVLDALRVFGNLKSNNYRYTIEELNTYIEPIKKMLTKTDIAMRTKS